jgi:hypothetical protein
MTMKILRTTLAAALAACTLGACAERPGRTPLVSTPQTETLPAFQSEQELGAYLRQLAKEQQTSLRREESAAAGVVTLEELPAEMAPAPDAAGSEGESVTNVQHAGVDEGGIVKVHGDYLVMLRRGRLFTVAVGGDTLRPVSAVDAFGPDVDPGGTWYDELLVSGDAVVVIGFSYARGGTEVGLFRITPDGRLSHRSTYHMRGNDYYSSRNYASRLIEGKLVFYTPQYLGLHEDDPFARFPAVRRWHRGAGEDEFRRILPATRVYRPGRPLHADGGVALHTVTVCDLASEEMECDGSAVLGPPGHVFYVAPGAVYVWTADWHSGEKAAKSASVLYRIPLDGSGPTALGVEGSPVDQFSFLESGDGHLNVLVRSDGAGDGMWNAEHTGGDAALLRIPLERFGDGSGSAGTELYRPLPVPAGYTFQNRFVGDYLLYGTGSGWGAPEGGRSTLYAAPWRAGAVTALPLPHGVDRIEVMGGDAVVVGTDGQNLHFSAVRLGEQPQVAQRYVSAGASQGELRSHGFFYKPDGRDSGILGLPIRGPGRPGYAHLVEGSASVLFLRNHASRFEELGELAAGSEGSGDDGCRASCVDWYGNARPLFLRGRIFALLGYEIVEGAVDGGRIRETRRISYTPQAAVAGR